MTEKVAATTVVMQHQLNVGLVAPTTTQVIHMEAAVQGLAAIVMNAYRGATESRGARGTAGSGSGTRTLVDGLSLSMAHNHWLAVNHLDLHASLPLQIPDHNNNDDGGRRGGEGGADETEKCRRGGLSRGFEAPPLDAAKVQWMGFKTSTCRGVVLGWTKLSGLQPRGLLVLLLQLYSPLTPLSSIARTFDNRNRSAHKAPSTVVRQTPVSYCLGCFVLSSLLFAAAASPPAAVRHPRARTPFHGPRAPSGRHRRVCGGPRVRRRLRHGLPRPAGTAHAGPSGGSPGAGRSA